MTPRVISDDASSPRLGEQKHARARRRLVAAGARRTERSGGRVPADRAELVGDPPIDVTGAHHSRQLRLSLYRLSM